MLAVMPMPVTPFPTNPEAPVQSISTEVDQLRAMFPDIDQALLVDVLASHRGDVEASVMSLLELSSNTETTNAAEQQDADFARALQFEQDEEVAKALAATLQNEMRAAAEQEKKAQQEKKAGAGEGRHRATMSGAAQKFLQGLQGRVTSSRASSHAAPLLDEPLDRPLESAYDMTPLAVQPYTPPSTAAAETAAPRPSTSDDGHHSVDTSARYSSRLDRARKGNRQRTQSRLSQPSPEQPSNAPLQASLAPLQASLAPLQASDASSLAPAVPEGQLI